MGRIRLGLLAIGVAICATAGVAMLAETFVRCPGEQLSCNLMGFLYPILAAAFSVASALILALAALWRGSVRGLWLAMAWLLLLIVALAILADGLGILAPRDPDEAMFVLGHLYGPMVFGVIAAAVTLWLFSPRSPAA